jgi:exodeoxyribonuclease VII small subunit
MSTAKGTPDFEGALNELEQLIEQLESGDLSLDDSLEAFEAGVKLTRECQKQLSKAEQKVQKLVQEQGQLQLEDFDDPAQDH